MKAAMKKAIDDLAQSTVMAAVSRLAVPIILALVITGIPAHLLWASKVQQDLEVSKMRVGQIAAEIDQIKANERQDARVYAVLREDAAALKTDVAAILRAMSRIEKQLDAIRK